MTNFKVVVRKRQIGMQANKQHINVTSKAQCNEGHNTKKEIGKLTHIHASLFRQGDFPFKYGTRSTGGTS